MMPSKFKEEGLMLNYVANSWLCSAHGGTPSILLYYNTLVNDCITVITASFKYSMAQSFS